MDDERKHRERVTYTAEQFEELQAMLRDAPPIDKQRNRGYGKPELVRALSKEIRALQKRGYTIEDIASMMRDKGVDIPSSAIRYYLKPKAKAPATKKAAPQQPAPQQQAPATKKAAPQQPAPQQKVAYEPSTGPGTFEVEPDTPLDEI